MSMRTLLIGTTKGAFLLNPADNLETWDLRGPFCDGWPINHMAGDPEAGRIWAGGGGAWNGAGVWHSEDGGETWILSKLSNGQLDDWVANDPGAVELFGQPAPPPTLFGKEIEAVWSLCFVQGILYAGAKPAMFFKSLDQGKTWEKLPALNDHPSAGDWQPGAAGLTLHSIVADPEDASRLWLGISAAGVFASGDGGQSWDRRNRRDNAPPHGVANHPAAGTADETGFCVHNIVRAKAESGIDLLYQQNHHGVYRSEDGGRSWHDITQGLPSTFGFPMAVHPDDKRTIWTLPLNGDMDGRYPPDASAAVWKSTDGGEIWTKKQDGLPSENCFFTVLRQAMAVDKARPAGLYFGTNSGSVFASGNEGESFSEVARHLPTVLCVETLETK